jgi:hypothetical protein
MKMEAIHSPETSVHTRSTRRHIPEDGILHSHRREDLKSYIIIIIIIIIISSSSSSSSSILIILLLLLSNFQFRMKSGSV